MHSKILISYPLIKRILLSYGLRAVVEQLYQSPSDEIDPNLNFGNLALFDQISMTGYDRAAPLQFQEPTNYLVATKLRRADMIRDKKKAILDGWRRFLDSNFDREVLCVEWDLFNFFVQLGNVEPADDDAEIYWQTHYGSLQALNDLLEAQSSFSWWSRPGTADFDLKAAMYLALHEHFADIEAALRLTAANLGPETAMDETAREHLAVERRNYRYELKRRQQLEISFLKRKAIP